ncbi:hypothetical protein BJ742DRAFT_796076 [Cladochytrium replicatum]|nr:hypothetical protein BJ742DRAFT_796076 [Cladochytrium replicatum]
MEEGKTESKAENWNVCWGLVSKGQMAYVFYCWFLFCFLGILFCFATGLKLSFFIVDITIWQCVCVVCAVSFFLHTLIFCSSCWLPLFPTSRFILLSFLFT